MILNKEHVMLVQEDWNNIRLIEEPCAELLLVAMYSYHDSIAHPGNELNKE